MSYQNPFATGPGAPPDTYGAPMYGAPSGSRPTAQIAPPLEATTRPEQYPQGWQRKTPPVSAGTVIRYIVLPAAFLIVLFIAGQGVGLRYQAYATLLALIPLGIVLGAVRWVDKWEPEPREAMIGMFLWGGGVAALGAFLVNTGSMMALSASQGARTAEFITSVAVAPVIEEILKGLGVLLAARRRPHLIDGPVDGLVYGMLVGGGFAFTENILYFSGAYAAEAQSASAQGLVIAVFFMRGVMSPFAHALFTGMTGLAIGWASQRPKPGLIPLVGLLAAIGLHALWNGSASAGQDAFFASYVSVQIPMLLIALGIALWLRARESAVLRARLSEYGQAGWYDANEIQMLSSLRLRKAASRWATATGGTAGRKAMKDFQETSTRLAYERNKLVLGRSRPDAAREQKLLGQLIDTRHRLAAAIRRR